MVIIAKASFPRRYLNQAVAAYTGLQPLPPEIVRTGPFFRTTTDIIQAIGIYNLPESAGQETLALLQERYRGFYAIPGFTLDIQEWREFREMLADWVE